MKTIIKKHLWILLSITVIIVIGFFPYYSNGRSLIWEIDGIGQYYPAFLYIGQWLRETISSVMHGSFSIRFFDLRIGFGEDVIGCLNYYGFGDPLNLLAIFTDKHTGPYIYTFMFFLRLFLAGGAFLLYCRYINIARRTAPLLMLAYIFHGFSLVGGARYIEFLSPMIWFPLMLLGTERLLREHKKGVLIFSIWYGAMCGFYFLYMTSIVWAVYSLIRAYEYSQKNWQRFLKLLCCGLICYIIALCLAAPFFLPSVYAFLKSARGSSHPLAQLLYYKNWIPSKKNFLLFLKGFKLNPTISYWRCIPLLEYILLLAAIIVKPCRRKKYIFCILLGILAWSTPITSIVMSAFGRRYFRWEFMMQFFFCIICASTLEIILDNYPKLFKPACWIFPANICLCVFLLNLSWSEQFVSFDKAVLFTDSPVSESAVLKEDSGLFRISTGLVNDINDRPENTAMLNNYNGLTFWWSIINGNTQRKLASLKANYRNSWRSYGLDSSAVYLSLAGVKYHLTKDKDSVIPDGFIPLENIQSNGKTWTLYENQNEASMISVYHDAISAKQYQKLSAPSKMISDLYYASVSGQNKPQGLIQKKAAATTLNNSFQLIFPSQIETDTDIRLLYQIPEGYEVTMYIKGLKQLKVQSYTLENISGDFRLSRKPHMYCLGSSFKSHQLIIRVKGYKGDINKLTKRFQVYLTESALIQENLKKRKTEVVDCNSTTGQLTTHVNLQTPGYVTAAIPGSGCWSVKIDGKKAKRLTINTLYLSVYAPEGQHTITFTYIPWPFLTGIMIMLLCLAACIFFRKVQKPDNPDK